MEDRSKRGSLRTLLTLGSGLALTLVLTACGGMNKLPTGNPAEPPSDPDKARVEARYSSSTPMQQAGEQVAYTVLSEDAPFAHGGRNVNRSRQQKSSKKAKQEAVAVAAVASKAAEPANLFARSLADTTPSPTPTSDAPPPKPLPTEKPPANPYAYETFGNSVLSDRAPMESHRDRLGENLPRRPNTWLERYPKCDNKARYLLYRDENHKKDTSRGSPAYWGIVKCAPRSGLGKILDLISPRYIYRALDRTVLAKEGDVPGLIFPGSYSYEEMVAIEKLLATAKDENERAQMIGEILKRKGVDEQTIAFIVSSSKGQGPTGTLVGPASTDPQGIAAPLPNPDDQSVQPDKDKKKSGKALKKDKKSKKKKNPGKNKQNKGKQGKPAKVKASPAKVQPTSGPLPPHSTIDKVPVSPSPTALFGGAAKQTSSYAAPVHVRHFKAGLHDLRAARLKMQAEAQKQTKVVLMDAYRKAAERPTQRISGDLLRFKAA